jgi:transposase-like protein
MNDNKTLIEVIRYFQDPQICIDTVAAMRWPEGKPVCPRCGGVKHYYLASQWRWKCAGCKFQFTVKVGTVMEDSPIPLDKWLITLWMLVSCKNGISSYEVHRSIDVTQKSAWFMLQRLRLALRDGMGGKLSGEVEADETFIGGKARNMHKSVHSRRISGGGRNIQDKIIVMGLLERGGKVRTQIIPDRQKPTLHPIVREHVEPGAALITDEMAGYKGLGKEYVHQIIDHAVQYVSGRIHTNGMENFWSLLKRGLGGTYISVEPFHLFRYLDEQVFRYNYRGTKKNPLKDADRFALALSQIAGKRLTYAEVTGKTANPF